MDCGLPPWARERPGWEVSLRPLPLSSYCNARQSNLTLGAALGSKARYIQRHFPSALVPDLHMSVWDPRKKNSATRNLANLQASLDGCVQDAMQAVREARGDSNERRKLLVVGSSWGGMVALQCIEEGLQPDATLLLAPALAAKGFFGWFWPQAALSRTILDKVPPKSVLVVHGTADDTVPVEASRRLATDFPAAVGLLEIPGGDHRLNDALNIRKDGDESKRDDALKDSSLKGLMQDMMAGGWDHILDRELRACETE